MECGLQGQCYPFGELIQVYSVTTAGIAYVGVVNGITLCPVQDDIVAMMADAGNLYVVAGYDTNYLNIADIFGGTGSGAGSTYQLGCQQDSLAQSANIDTGTTPHQMLVNCAPTASGLIGQVINLGAPADTPVDVSFPVSGALTPQTAVLIGGVAYVLNTSSGGSDSIQSFSVAADGTLSLIGTLALSFGGVTSMIGDAGSGYLFLAYPSGNGGAVDAIPISAGTFGTGGFVSSGLCTPSSTGSLFFDAQAQAIILNCASSWSSAGARIIPLKAPNVLLEVDGFTNDSTTAAVGN